MVIGIDGGGTKTKLMLLDEQNNIMDVINVGPSSIRTVPFETSIQTLVDGLKKIITPQLIVTSIFAGLGDVTGEEDAKRVVDALKASFPRLNDIKITVKNDVYNAHAGALNGEEGIALIIGTGSVAFGIDATNKKHRAGGYSYKEGDLGSAYGLGSQALSLMGKVFDHRLEPSALSDALFKHYNVQTFPEMVNMYDTFYTRRTEVAATAKIVTTYAEKHDEHAVNIIETATDEIMLMIKAVDQTLQFEKKQIAIIGSLGQADTLLRRLLEQKLSDYDQHYQIFNSLKDPVYGACLMARKYQ